MIPLAVVLLLAQERVDKDAACVKCHESQQEDFRGSIHDRHRVGCVSCHGADDVNPKLSRAHLRRPTFRAGTRRTDSPELCGACHKAEMESFKEGDHFSATQAGEGQMRGCNSCHGYHATTPASRTAILDNCVKCHKPDTFELDRGRKYVEQAGELEARLARLEGRLREKRPGISWFDEAETYESGARVLQSVRTAQHACSYAKLQKVVAASAGAAAGAYNTLERKERAFGKRYWGLVGFLALLAANAALIRIRGRRWRQTS